MLNVNRYNQDKPFGVPNNYEEYKGVGTETKSSLRPTALRNTQTVEYPGLIKEKVKINFWILSSDMQGQVSKKGASLNRPNSFVAND